MQSIIVIGIVIAAVGFIVWRATNKKSPGDGGSASKPSGGGGSVSKPSSMKQD